MKRWKHFKTITKHKCLVMQGCFKVGLVKQGLLHDLSKYMPSEFRIGAKYFQGNRSPNNAEREELGYSTAWLHHKGRNKHHYEYWIDYSATAAIGMVPAPMPVNYIIEMVMDRIAASKVYRGENYCDEDPLLYYQSGKAYESMHETTREQLELLLTMLAQEGETKTFQFIKNEILKKKQ